MSRLQSSPRPLRYPRQHAQFRQYRVQSVRLRVTAEDFAARSLPPPKVPVSIMIRQHTINVPPPRRFTPSIVIRYRCPASGDLRPQRNREVSGVDTISGSRAAFSMMYRPSASVAAHIMVTVAPTLTLSITICAPLRRPSTEALRSPLPA